MRGRSARWGASERREEQERRQRLDRGKHAEVQVQPQRLVLFASAPAVVVDAAATGESGRSAKTWEEA